MLKSYDRDVNTIHTKAFKRLYFHTYLKKAGVEESELPDYYRSVIKSVVQYVCLVWSTGITKGQSESLKQFEKCAMYVITSHMQYKKAITKFNLPTIKYHLDNSNCSEIYIVDNHSHRLHYFLPQPRAAKRTLYSTSKYEPPKCHT